MNTPTCCARTWPKGSYSQGTCGRKASAEVDGKHYCGTHNPIKVAERRAAQEAIYEQRSKEFHAEWDRKKEAARRAECFPDLLAACKAMVAWDDAENNARPYVEDGGIAFRNRLQLCAEAFDKARDAIKKAEGV